MRNAWQAHQDVLANAGSLLGTMVVNSALGFAYWAFAAHHFRTDVVGYASATVSAMSLIGILGTFGLGTMLVGELPRRSRRLGLISAALLAAVAASFVLALCFVAISPLISRHLGHITHPLDRALLFIGGVASFAACMVFDDATIGLLRGELQLARNLILAVTKLLLLMAVVAILPQRSDISVTLPWIAAAVLSLALVAVRLRRTGVTVLPRPDWLLLRRLGRTTAAHSWLNLALGTPALLMPVLVTVVISPAANAAFYASWMLATILYLIPTQVAMTLFAAAAADMRAMAPKLRLALGISILIGAPAMACMIFGSHIMLGLYGPSYTKLGKFTLTAFAVGYLPLVPKSHYVAVCRAANNISRAAALLSVTAAAELAVAGAAGTVYGLPGLSLGLLAMYCIEGLITAPAVLRAALPVGKHAAVGCPATSFGGQVTGRSVILDE